MAGIPGDEIDDEQLWAHLTIARGVDPGTAVPLSRATTELHPPTIYHWLRPGDAKRQRRVSGDLLFYYQDEGEAPGFGPHVHLYTLEGDANQISPGSWLPGSPQIWPA